MKWTVLEPSRNGGHVTARFFWWARAWRWDNHGDTENLWVFTRLFVGPGAYDRAMKWATSQSIDSHA